MVTVNFLATDDADLSLLPPKRASSGAAGFDLCANLAKPISITSMERAIISTGLMIELPEFYEAQIRPRSGLAIKSGITVINSPGTIDWDYRGEIKIGLINLSKDAFEITHGLRIAQMVIAPVSIPEFVEVVAFDATIRGEKGFGSTGR